MNSDDAPLAGLLDTYDVAIAELEELDDPAVGTLLASLRTLRQRASGSSRKCRRTCWRFPDLRAERQRNAQPRWWVAYST
jgi:hypothetical protein